MKTVKIEVLKGVARDRVLCVNDTRVAGPKSGPYDTEYTFTVDIETLLSALGMPKVNCWACNREAAGKPTTAKHVCGKEAK